MIFIAALLFGVAVWVSDPIGAGILVALGVLVTAEWMVSNLRQVVSNQQSIAKIIRKDR